MFVPCLFRPSQLDRTSRRLCQGLNHIVLCYAKEEKSLEERRNEMQKHVKICVGVTRQGKNKGLRPESISGPQPATGFDTELEESTEP
jgi:hypothetical protein